MILHPLYSPLQRSVDPMHAVIEGHTINPLAFARTAAHLAGELDLAQASRLAELIVVPGSEVHFDLRGAQEGNKLFLLLKLSGHLQMQCQRCLEPMQWRLDQTARYRLISEGPLPEDDIDCDEYDVIPVTSTLVWPELIEEEVLLSLPMVPRHEACTMPSVSGHSFL